MIAAIAAIAIMAAAVTVGRGRRSGARRAVVAGSPPPVIVVVDLGAELLARDAVLAHLVELAAAGVTPLVLRPALAATAAPRGAAS